MKRVLAIFLLCLFSLAARAHIGSPNVFFEGRAGEFPVRVVIRPPNVVPGLAEISIRVQPTNGQSIQRVSALPVFWRAGRNGAPLPDVAQPVTGETNLYSAALWLMKSGSYSVEVTVEGATSRGSLIIPVNSVATNTRPMSTPYAALLVALGVILFLGLLQIAAAAFGQSMVGPDAAPTSSDRSRGRVAMAVAALIVGVMVFGGKKWWDHEDRMYRVKSLYQPTPISARITQDHDQNILRLKILPADRRRDWTPLLPDHGKMMHLFLVQDGKSGAFAHLHPTADAGDREFRTPLPPLPTGRYFVYADITHESGFAETLTTTVDVPKTSDGTTQIWMGDSREPICAPATFQRLAAKLVIPPDVDDSWSVTDVSFQARAFQKAGFLQNSVTLDGGYELRCNNSTLVMDKDETLRFQLFRNDGVPAFIQPYMGMLGHAVVRHDDGSVFAHIHPSGTFSMAAQEAFAGGELRADKIGLDPNDKARGSHHTHTNGVAEAVSFPYAFPKPGAYRIWVQTKTEGRIVTGVFRCNVAKPAN